MTITTVIIEIMMIITITEKIIAIVIKVLMTITLIETITIMIAIKIQ